VIWDPSHTTTISAAADLSKADYTVYEGWQVTGWPITVVRRGRIVFEDGAITGEPGSGIVVPRQPRQ